VRKTTLVVVEAMDDEETTIEVAGAVVQSTKDGRCDEDGDNIALATVRGVEMEDAAIEVAKGFNEDEVNGGLEEIHILSNDLIDCVCASVASNLDRGIEKLKMEMIKRSTY